MDEDRKERLKYFGFAGFVGLLLLLNVTGLFRTVFGVDTAAIITVLAGYRIFYNSISALLEKEISADLAICIAVIAALSIGEYAAAAEAMFVMLIGEGIEGYAAGRTSAAISRFVEQMPRVARRLRGELLEEVAAGDLIAGDLIEVRAGERIPADGVIEAGSSEINEATITGEPVPREKASGAEVYSGTLNGNGLLRVRVARAGDETTLARVIALVEEAKERRAPVERLADQYAKYFLPALLLAAAGTFWYTRDWLRTVAVLLVACPCALILATPTAMVAAIGGLARRGILVRSGEVLQRAAKVDTVVFDKTGTITEGRFEVVRVAAVDGDEERLLRMAAGAERGSEHILAKVILEHARALGASVVEDARVIPGRGAEAVVDGRRVRVGNALFLEGVEGVGEFVEDADRMGATAVLVAEEDRLAGALFLRDRVRAGAKDAVRELSDELEITYQVMLTGDRKRAADVVAREVGIPNVEAELLPVDKLERIRQMTSQGRVVAMCGDGLNDAPSLAAAQVGIAMHGAADISAEAAGVVYLGDSLEKLPKLFDVSRRAVATAWQNIFLFAGLVNVCAVVAAATGVIGPIGAAFTHQLSSLFVMLNSLRLLWVERPGGRTWRVPYWDRVRTWMGAFDPRGEFNWVMERRAVLMRPALYAVGVLWVLNGMYVIGPDEVGVIERFGKKVMPLDEPGLHYKMPWPVDKLTRVQAKKVRVVEVGFRGRGDVPDVEPAAYEWNVQHRAGRFEKRPEESLMLTGDQNMIELNAVVHYRLRNPEDYLFAHYDGESTIRTATESVIQGAVTSTGLDEMLTSGRRQLEMRIKADLQVRLDKYKAGAEVLAVKLLDVHPSLEVVDAFRDVSGAYEEKNRLINVAEGYRNEQVALARGNGQAKLASAAGYSEGRKNRSAGDASRFTQWEKSFALAPGPNQTRLYLETMEQVLPGKKKMIVDSNNGKRHLVMLEDGVELGAGMAVTAAGEDKK